MQCALLFKSRRLGIFFIALLTARPLTAAKPKSFVVVTPTSLAVGSALVNTSLAPQAVTISNTGASALAVNVSISGDFSQTNTCNGAVPANSSCTVGVTFSPKQNGNRTGTLTFKDSDPSSPQRVSLSGNGQSSIKSISLSPANPAIPLGTTQKFSAKATLPNGAAEDISGYSAWSSSSPGVASVTSSGLATSVAQGSTTISASLSGRKGSATLIVQPAALVSVGVSPVNPSIPLSTTQQFTATGVYTDNSNQNLTNSVIWSSSDTTMVAIGSNGLATAIRAGAVLVTAASGNVNGSTTLTVTAGFTPTGALVTGRIYQTATLLNNGKVLVAGGQDGSTILASAELYDPATGTFTPTGSLVTGRYHHTATLLNNGEVLLVGGVDNSGNTLGDAELYDPASEIFAPVGNLASGRYDHVATLLQDGKVLITGGGTNVAIFAGSELYDPSTGTFTSTGNMGTARSSHTATLLNDGKVLIAGGYYGSIVFASSEVYDPTTGLFSTTGDMTIARLYHKAMLLNDGQVLVVGGQTYFSGILASAEIYNPSTGVFSATGSMSIGRVNDSATLLNNGQVLIAGGSNHGGLASAEIYDPSNGTFAMTSSLMETRYLHAATLMNTGQVLISGGVTDTGDPGYVHVAELY